MKEKRKKARAPLDIYLNKFVSGVPYTARATDISPDGLSVANLIEPSSGAKRVGLQFQLPGCEEVIYAEGEVVREWAGSNHRDGAGIRFTLLTDRHRQLIDDYVQEHGPGPQES